MKALRPNVVTIRGGYARTPVAQVVQTREDRNARALAQEKRPGRGMVQDMCDFCHAIGFLSRAHLEKRRYGFKFACADCQNSGKPGDVKTIRIHACGQ